MSQIKNTPDIPNLSFMPEKYKQFIDFLFEFKAEVLDDKPPREEPLWQLHPMTVKKRLKERLREAARNRLVPEETVLHQEVWNGIP